jgi:O-antigen/teichoic acid export membrane protein
VDCQNETATQTDSTSFIADSLATGMIVMLSMTIVQRGLGFFRGIWFCRLLDDTEVGVWAMAFGFVTLITPIILLGIPGSLPRYVEHYRSRGHLPAFVRRVLWTTGTLVSLFLVAVVAFPDWFGWLVFLEPQNPSLVLSVGLASVAIIAFFFVGELVTSLRQVRVASLMQFLQSVGFTVAGVLWLSSGGSISGLVMIFATVSVIATAPGLWTLRQGWKGLPTSTEPFDSTGMWKRVLPYAIALWAMNLLANLFDLSDRYMILHLTQGGELAGQAAVGQYHSGRIIPMLLISLATMIAGIQMPYLTADWENGDREGMIRRLRQTLLGLGAFFTLGAAAAMLLSPMLFSVLLEDRYTVGMELMPMVFTFCIWSSLFTVGQNYLWVAEKGKWVGVSLGIGLVSNLILNAALLPIWGLHGAVIATLCSNGIVMAGIWYIMHRRGFRFDATMMFISLWPLSLIAGAPIAIVCVLLSLLVHEAARDACREVLQNERIQRVTDRIATWTGQRIGSESTAAPREH